jgi:hypothetical protein
LVVTRTKVAMKVVLAPLADSSILLERPWVADGLVAPVLQLLVRF